MKILLSLLQNVPKVPLVLEELLPNDVSSVPQELMLQILLVQHASHVQLDINVLGRKLQVHALRIITVPGFMMIVNCVPQVHL